MDREYVQFPSASADFTFNRMDLRFPLFPFRPSLGLVRIHLSYDATSPPFVVVDKAVCCRMYRDKFQHRFMVIFSGSLVIRFFLVDASIRGLNEMMRGQVGPSVTKYSEHGSDETSGNPPNCTRPTVLL